MVAVSASSEGETHTSTVSAVQYFNYLGSILGFSTFAVINMGAVVGNVLSIDFPDTSARTCQVKLIL